MPKINKYVDIDTVEREARKDYIDRHSPFIHCADSVNAGEVIAVTIKMGNEYTHPDDFDHYIASISLFNGETLLAKADFMAGMLGGTGCKGHSGATFNVVATGKKMNFVAHAYCTKHGVWESTPKVVEVIA
ncbi:MAG: class II SORL domain-containing protein [Epsilonproteobacteria bacterium]|nr:class II SORL domain-containing protein [Campylobacterota bacterium]MBD3839396.1 class II SORL domain-containing protein [Campylobacterota bacterium]